MCPRNQFDYSTEDFEIQGILSKELKDKWLTDYARFAPITEFESPESPPGANSASLLYSPISPALSPEHSGYTPISNCSPISSNPSRYSLSEESDESSDESSSKAFTWTTFPSPIYSSTSPRPSPSKYSMISDSDSYIRDDICEMPVKEFYNPIHLDTWVWHKPEDPEPIDEDMEKDQDLDDIDQNLAWLRPSKLSSSTEDQDEYLDDIDQTLAWLK